MVDYTKKEKSEFLYVNVPKEYFTHRNKHSACFKYGQSEIWFNLKHLYPDQYTILCNISIPADWEFRNIVVGGTTKTLDGNQMYKLLKTNFKEHNIKNTNN